MRSHVRHAVLFRLAVIVLCSAATLGCGTTKWTDTRRAATEQVLLSDAMDRAVSELDFRALAGKTVFLDSTYVKNATDWEYLISTMRQHMLASGCVLRDKKEEADYIVEVRAGAIGTDRHDLLYGVPATEFPSFVALAGVPSAIPEMPFVKKTEQRGVARVAVFAYNTKTGRPVWQSGVIPVESNAKDLWVLGAGPFQRGTIYDGTKFAGDKLTIPLIDPTSDRDRQDHFSVADEAYFAEPVETEVAEEQMAEKQVAETTVTKATAQAKKEVAPPKAAAELPKAAAAIPKAAAATPKAAAEPPKTAAEPPKATATQAAATPVPETETTAAAPKAPTTSPAEQTAPMSPATSTSASPPKEVASGIDKVLVAEPAVSPAGYAEVLEEEQPPEKP